MSCDDDDDDDDDGDDDDDDNDNDKCQCQCLRQWRRQLWGTCPPRLPTISF